MAADPEPADPPRRRVQRGPSFYQGDPGDVHEYEVQSPEPHDYFDFDSEADSAYGAQPKLLLGGNFITTRRNSTNNGISDKRSARCVHRCLRNSLVRNLMGLVTLSDAVFTCLDIDARAQGPGVSPPNWLVVASNICLASYLIEFLLWMWVRPLERILRDKFLMIDFAIIVVGYSELILLAAGLNIEYFTWLRILRIGRILRLLKLFRKIPYLKELQKLVNMTSTCMKTLGWSFIFCFVIMTIWAMLMVEFVHPLILELNERYDLFDEEMLRAASTVMHANLLLFKTVIAGDSWGEIAVPLIQAYPATAIIFVGSLLTLVFGVLQLIVAVVVDTFAEKRERDVLNRAEEMENDIEEDKRFLQRIFDRVDEDGSGELTLDELIEGAKKDPEFQSRLRVMDIDESDLSQLFMMIDVKGTGQVSPEEFIQPLSRWVHESKTANRFVKYNVMRTMHQNDELRAYTCAKFDALSTQIQRIATSLGVSLDAATQSSRRASRRLKKSHTSEFKEKDSKDHKPKKSDTAEWERSVTDESREVASSISTAKLTSEASIAVDENKPVAERLSQIEVQLRLILDNLSGAFLPLEARERTRDPMQGPDLNSQSLSSYSGASGGVPGGTVARHGSLATPPKNADEKEGSASSVPPLPATLSTKNLELLEDQFREGERGGFAEREIDAVLQSSMVVIEDLLQSAASQACVKATAKLRERLQSLLSQGTAPLTSQDNVANGSSGCSSLANVKQVWREQVHQKASLRPKAPDNPRQVSLGDEIPSELSGGTQL